MLEVVKSLFTALFGSTETIRLVRARNFGERFDSSESILNFEIVSPRRLPKLLPDLKENLSSRSSV